jgi:hypothetical protein
MQTPAAVLTEGQIARVVAPAHVADHGPEGTAERVPRQVGRGAAAGPADALLG